MRTALLAGVLPLLLLSAEAQAQSGQSMPSNTGSMQNMPGMAAGKATSASATGTVESVNAHQRKIKLNHEPIPAINWPAMTMEFPTAQSVDFSKMAVGAKVRFTLSGSNGSYILHRRFDQPRPVRLLRGSASVRPDRRLRPPAGS